jgi:hypothetical protein
MDLIKVAGEAGLGGKDVSRRDAVSTAVKRRDSRRWDVADGFAWMVVSDGIVNL